MRASGWNRGSSSALVNALSRQSNIVRLSPNGMMRTGGASRAVAGTRMDTRMESILGSTTETDQERTARLWLQRRAPSLRPLPDRVTFM